MKNITRENTLIELKALKAEVTDEFYNVGKGTKTSIKELAELLLKITGSNLKIEYKPEGKTFVTNRIGSTDKAEKDLGFKAKIELEEGLKRLIKWRKEHKEKFGGNWKVFE